MTGEPFGMSIGELASATLQTAGHPLDEFGPNRGRVLDSWREIFEMSRPSQGEAIDWRDVRNNLWNHVPREVMTDQVFRRVLSSTIVELYGTAVGLVAVNTVFIPRPGR